MKPSNPFLITGYHSPEYFCDRIRETSILTEALANGRNLTLIAPRRMGKTGLIKNIYYKMRETSPEIVTLYMDIFSTQNLGDFTRLFGNTVLGTLDSAPQKALSRIGKFIKSCRPVFSFNEITGQPQVSLDIAPAEETSTLKEIFNYLASSEHRCYIAIDEFQQIGEYPEKGIEALLRGYIQDIPNVNFIFAGSQQHVMQEMFLSAKRPFYQSTQTLSLDAIDKAEYHVFADGFFRQQGYPMPREVFDRIYDDFDGHTWYIQSILNRLYSYQVQPTEGLVGRAVAEIVAEQEYYYQNLLAAYTKGAVRLLKAIARERIVPEINAGSFIRVYKLTATSSVNTALKNLLNRELVYKTPNGYIIYDRFLAIWLRNQAF